MNPATLPRIFGAIFYDIMIVFAIVFVAAQWFPLLSESAQINGMVILFKQLYILGIGFLYFAYSWRRGGQTIGMKAWRIRLENRLPDSISVSWQQCLIRYLVAIVSWLAGGLGFVWVIFSREHNSWHDAASKTRLTSVPKN